MRIQTIQTNKIILQQADFYKQSIEPVMRFLSGRDSSLAQRFCNRDFWPVSKRLPGEDDLEWGFGMIGITTAPSIYVPVF